MIFIAGGTGFVGHHLLTALEGQGCPVRCLVRNEQKVERITNLGFEAVVGDLSDAGSLAGKLDGVRTLIHLVGIIEEQGNTTFESVHVKGTENLINEAIAAGVKHLFYQSALGADPGSPFAYLNTKARAETVVTSSGIDYTIFRPSLIVGEGDGFTERMRQLVTLGPVVPVPGDGTARFQPLFIDDWRRAFQKVLDEEVERNRTYEIGGPEQLTYNEILQEILNVLDLQKPVVHLPMGLTRMSLPFMGLARSAASLLGREIPGVTADLLALLSRDNICETDSMEKFFGVKPVRFAEALKIFLGKENKEQSQ